MEHCLVYFSTWKGDFNENELAAILDQYRPYNQVAGITSVTLYVRGHIIQVIEGPKQAVEDLYERIQADDRHTQVHQVLSRPIQERLFSGYALGYETITERQLEAIQTIVDLDNSNPDLAQAGDNLILKLIKVFYESNRYN